MKLLSPPLLQLILVLCWELIQAGNDTLDNQAVFNEIEDVDEPLYNEQFVGGNATLKEIFEGAVDAYLEENWHRCVDEFNRAVHGYKTYRRVVTECRRKCRQRASGEQPSFRENIEDLHFYEKKVAETLCLLTCNQDYRDVLGARPLSRLPHDIEQKFIDRVPYEYLHICYYKIGAYQEAANAVYTYLVTHPKHEPNIEALKFYLTLPNVDEEKVRNMETMPYVSIYYKGVEAYEDGNYEEAVALFESSLKSYLESEEECRFYCEGPFDQGWHPEFTSSVANHFAFCLKCKRACAQLLKNINGDYRSDMLRSHYDYLQYSYYKLRRLKDACAAVESYLLFTPMDETMLHNKEYYSAQPKVRDSYFIPREEIINYLKREEYEKRLMMYIVTEFRSIEKRLERTSRKNVDGNENRNSEHLENEGKVKTS